MRRALAAAVLFTVATAAPALAHSAARGFVLLLPVGYVIAGGALTVLASFMLVSLMSGGKAQAVPARPERPGSVFISLCSAAILLGLMIAGFRGPHDPTENLLPLFVWTVFWVVIVLAHPVFGNFWRSLNPFTGLHALLQRSSQPPLAFPPRLAYWPAFAIFAAFAWFQLIDPAPEDPHRLGLAVAFYAAFTLAMVFLFGPAEWLGKADPFAIFLSQLGAAAPFSHGSHGLPGAGLLRLRPLPVAGALFVLLTLSSISFDGFANTFFWLSRAGINPLDYPGRTAMVPVNSLGLAASFAALAVAYSLAIATGWLWSGKPDALAKHFGRFVLSLIPISIAYHFAHYLSDALLSLQYVALALNDPFESGANLLGLEGWHATASFQNSWSGALVLFSLQTAAIVSGHIIAVAVAHAMARDATATAAAALRLELPLAAFMVVYTAFGLWLLATPAIS